MTLFDGSTLHPLRQPCLQCDHEVGVLLTRGGQDCVFCDNCGKHQYNAPRTETGRALRTVSTTHEAITPSRRRRVLARANWRCELCLKQDGPVQVSHLLSVLDGHALGVDDALLNSADNLAAMCDECNLGLGRLSVEPRLYIALLRRRQIISDDEGAA